jgi:predicted transcriptional regulator
VPFDNNLAERDIRGQALDGMVTLSFEGPQRMITVLSQERRLMSAVMPVPKTINELTNCLRRNRSAVTKEVGMLERMVLILSSRQCNPGPGHGIQRPAQFVAPTLKAGRTVVLFIKHEAI